MIRMAEITNPKLNKELAEEIGIHIGDGSLGIYEKTGHYDYTITGGLEDKTYLLEFVVLLMHKLYNLKPYIQENKNYNYIMLKYVSKALIIWKQNMGLPVGPKNDIRIPPQIAESNFVLDCLRGIFDTDGSISFKKRDKKRNYYPVVKLSSKSKNLIKQIDEILKKEGIISNIQYNVIRNDKRGFSSVINELHINGENGLNKFIKKIGFSNQKHLTKYFLWKKEGYLKPYTSLEERLKILSNLSRSSSGVERHSSDQRAMLISVL